MSNKTSMLLAAAVVALSAGAAGAADTNYNRHDNDDNRDATTMTGDADQTVYGSGYNYGYDDGYARRERNDRYRADAWRAQGGNLGGYQRGAYYYGSDCGPDTTTGTFVGATVAGVILGGVAGNSISRDMDCGDRRYALTSYSAGFEGRIGERHDWSNGRDRGSFTPVREYMRDGNTCRDFREASYRDGHDYSRGGTACRRNDGNWYME